jgi:ankyrin repeat protein
MALIHRFSFLVAVFVFLLDPLHALAQVAPSPIELSGYSDLHRAAHVGDIDALTALIKSGSDLEARDSSGRTPAIIAAFASHDQVVEVLAGTGANLNAMEHQAYDIVTIASVANDVEMLGLVLELGASASNITSPYDGTALIAAAHLGHHEVVGQLIEYKAPLDHVNNLNWTALIEAVVLGDGGPAHTKTVQLLLEAGADQSIGDAQGVTPLDHALRRGYEQIVQLLTNNQ